MTVALVKEAVLASEFVVTEVVSGGAGGPDRAGEKWAQQNSIPISVFKANWRLGRGAGIALNAEMAANADALIALYDGKSKGTLDMIRSGDVPLVVKTR